ncbi:MAG: ABC transporter substrate-binding protein [Nocardioidaceae bacterium]
MRWAVALAAGGCVVGLAACAPPSSNNSNNSAPTAGSTNQSQMAALVKAAKAEGTLNVIALPPTWANYGAVISAFAKKYGIKVNQEQPDAASQDEINAAKQLHGTDRAPDVFDLSQAGALANTSMFAPYKVSTWDTISANIKDPSGTWVNDYGGYMSIGYDSSKVPAVTSLGDLTGSAFKGKVALNGDPTTAGAAFAGVMMASLANGGSADNIQPGIDYFSRLKQAGSFLPVDPTPARSSRVRHRS